MGTTTAAGAPARPKSPPRGGEAPSDQIRMRRGEEFRGQSRTRRGGEVRDQTPPRTRAAPCDRSRPRRSRASRPPLRPCRSQTMGPRARGRSTTSGIPAHPSRPSAGGRAARGWPRGLRARRCRAARRRPGPLLRPAHVRFSPRALHPRQGHPFPPRRPRAPPAGRRRRGGAGARPRSRGRRSRPQPGAARRVAPRRGRPRSRSTRPSHDQLGSATVADDIDVVGAKGRRRRGRVAGRLPKGERREPRSRAPIRTREVACGGGGGGEERGRNGESPRRARSAELRRSAIDRPGAGSDVRRGGGSFERRA